MKNKMFFYTLPLTGHQFKGEASSMSELFNAFIMWAEINCQINLKGAVALWFNGSFDGAAEFPKGFGFKPSERLRRAARIAAKQLPEDTTICTDLSHLVVLKYLKLKKV